MARSALVDFASLAHLHPDNYRFVRFIEKVAPMLLGVGLVVSGGVALVGLTLQALPVLGMSAGFNVAVAFIVSLLVAAACSYHVRKKIVQEQERLPDMPAAPKDSDAEVKGIYANIMYTKWQNRVLYPTLNVLAAYALLIASVRAGFVLVPTLTVLGMSQTLSVLLASSLLVLSNVVFRVLATMAVRGRRETYRKCHVAFSRALLRYNRLSSMSYNPVPAPKLPVAQDPTLSQTSTTKGDLAVAPAPVVVKGQTGKGVDDQASGSDGAVAQNDDNLPNSSISSEEPASTQTTSKKQAPSVSSGTDSLAPKVSQDAVQSVPSSAISSTPTTNQDGVQLVTGSTSKENQGYGDSEHTPPSIAVSKGNQANTNAQHDMSTTPNQLAQGNGTDSLDLDQTSRGNEVIEVSNHVLSSTSQSGSGSDQSNQDHRSELSAEARYDITEIGEISKNSRPSTPISDLERNKQEGQQTASTEGTPSFFRDVSTTVKGQGSGELSPSSDAGRLAGANKQTSNQELQSPVISGTVKLLPSVIQNDDESSEQPLALQRKVRKKKSKGKTSQSSGSNNNALFSLFGLSGKGPGGNNVKRR